VRYGRQKWEMETRKLRLSDNTPESAEEIIRCVYQALKAKGHDPFMQIVGYLISGDPTYITSYNNAVPSFAGWRGRAAREFVRFYWKTTINKCKRSNWVARGSRCRDCVSGPLPWPRCKKISPRGGRAAPLVRIRAGRPRFLDTADLYETYPHIRRALCRSVGLCCQTKAYCYDRVTAQAALERAYGAGSRLCGRVHAPRTGVPSTPFAATRRRSRIFPSRSAWATSASWREHSFRGLRPRHAVFPEIDVVHPSSISRESVSRTVQGKTHGGVYLKKRTNAASAFWP
jgi:uncharacterized protein (UPF0297 family)